MRLFGKKKKQEEEYEDDEFEEERPRRRKRRLRDEDFKDLNPENSKKRKTPPKPWGKRERMTVLIALGLTVGLSAIFYMSSKNWYTSLVSGFANTFNKFGANNYELEGTTEEQNKARSVIAEFNNKTKGLSGVYGFYVLRLGTDTGYGIGQDETFQAASLIKLPVVIAMYKEAEAGGLKLDAKYVLKEQDKLKGAGSLSGKPAGYELTYRSMLRLMGKQSDNTAFNIARKTLGDEIIIETISNIGMDNTSFEKNTTTPKDVAEFFYKLWNGELITQASRDEMIEFLQDTIYEDWLAAGTPDVKVAHKFGREVNVLNDAGIVFAEKPYVLVIMGKGIVEREANSFYPDFSSFVYSQEGM
jgi:beta-lactamase class A